MATTRTSDDEAEALLGTRPHGGILRPDDGYDENVERLAESKAEWDPEREAAP